MLARTCPSKSICWWSGPCVLVRNEILALPSGLAGVYALMSFVPAVPHCLVYYIAQSVDIARRLDEHTRSPKPFLCGVHCYLHTYFTVAASRTQPCVPRPRPRSFGCSGNHQPAPDEHCPALKGHKYEGQGPQG
jgi:hypothetical protein